MDDLSMLDLNDLAFFVRIVDAGGFTAASRQLGVSKSTLSQRIRRLEEKLDTRLIQRTSRRFVVTDAGRELHRHASAMLIEAEAAESALRGRAEEPRGVVRLTCPVNAEELPPLLARFLVKYPQVRVLQHASNRFIDIVAEGFDVALRGHDAPLPDSDLVQRPLARAPWQLFASPAYVDAASAPATPGDLVEHACLMVPNRSGETVWTLRHEDGSEVRLELEPRLASDDLQAIKAAAVAGLGIGALPVHLCRGEREAGRLRRVLPGWTTGDARFTLLTPSRRGRLPAVRALVDFLVAEYPSALSAENRPRTSE
jgi:DNA-binding transcriptional LysR family regulator